MYRQNTSHILFMYIALYDFIFCESDESKLSNCIITNERRQRCMKKLYHKNIRYFDRCSKEKLLEWNGNYCQLYTVCTLPAPLNFRETPKFLGEKFLSTYRLLGGVRSMRIFYGPLENVSGNAKTRTIELLIV